MLLIGVSLGSCSVTTAELKGASTQLSPTIMDIEREQVLQNIGAFIAAGCDAGRCSAMPSQFLLGGGQAQISNQVQAPNLMMNVQGAFFKSFSVQDQNQWVQTWSVTPVIDYSDLQRLSLLYRYAVTLGSGDNTQIMKSFTAAYIQQLLQNNATSISPYSESGAVDGSQYNMLPMPLPPIDTSTTDMTKQLTSLPTSDKWPVRLPYEKWIYWERNNLPSGLKYEGEYSGYPIYVRESDLNDFVRWVLGATVNTAASAKSGGGKAPGLALPPIAAN